MAVLKQLLIVFAGLAGLAFLISFVLPSHWEVARQMQINAENHAVHAQVSDLATWGLWSPWSRAVDPKAALTVSPDSNSIGSTLEWKGAELGKGSLKITASDMQKGVWFDLALRGGKEPVKGVVEYVESPSGGCMVKITLRGDVSASPVGRYVALMRGYTAGPDLVDALLRLKRKLERGV